MHLLAYNPTQQKYLIVLILANDQIIYLTLMLIAKAVHLARMCFRKPQIPSTIVKKGPTTACLSNSIINRIGRLLIAPWAKASTVILVKVSIVLP